MGAIFITAGAIFLAGLTVANAAGCSPFLVASGGTGKCTFSASQLLYGAGTGAIQTVATSSVSAGAGISFTGTPGYLVGGTSLTISATGAVVGTVSTSSLETATRVPFWTTTSAYPALLSGGSANFTWDNSNSILSSLHYLATGSSTLQNFTGINATTTSATSTSFFSTTASSTNLFGQLINGFGLSSCVTTSALTWTGGAFGCVGIPQGTVTAVTATWPITSSGGATPNLTWSGLASSTNIANTQVLFATAANTYASNAAFTFNTTGNLLTVTNASTTALTVSAYFNATAGGLMTGSSTIGSATQTTGLTVNGGATTTLNAYFGSKVGIGSTTPSNALTLDRDATHASSTILVYEYRYGQGSNIATSTSANIDCRTSSQFHWGLGTSATALTLVGIQPGQKCIVIAENPNSGTPGALTFTAGTGYTLLWVGGTAPTPTATNNKQDVYSFIGTQASSTIDIIGAVSLNF